jgi:hypothetical protein
MHLHYPAALISSCLPKKPIGLDTGGSLPNTFSFLGQNRFCRLSAFVQLLLALVVVLPGSARADDSSDPWQFFLDHCSDLNLPVFQSRFQDFESLAKQGQTWEASMNAEKIQVDLVTNQTCKEWAANPNGDTALRDFLDKFTRVSSTAIALKGTVATILSPKMSAWWKTELAEMRNHGFDFSSSPCGIAFQMTNQHIQDQVSALEAKFAILRAKCPSAADSLPVTQVGSLGGVKSTKGDGGGRVPAGTGSPPGNSNITGTQDALQGDQKNSRILNTK